MSEDTSTEDLPHTHQTNQSFQGQAPKRDAQPDTFCLKKETNFEGWNPISQVSESAVLSKSTAQRSF